MGDKTNKQLFSQLDCTIVGNADEVVHGIAYRSDRVSPGDMFFCIVGQKADGHDFAQDAIDRGARTLVVERSVLGADTSSVTEIIVADTRKALARVSAYFFDDPSQDFHVVGITGTNGKTTTAYLVESILKQAGKKAGLIGTVGIQVGDEQLKSSHTTPESYDLQQIFAAMRDRGCEAVVMEVSSHALDLQRTWGTDFTVSVFTNLTQDHLDYHKTFESYFEAKAQLFSADYPAKRVICIDNPYGQELYERCSAAGDTIITTGFDEKADIHPEAVTYDADNTTVELIFKGVRFAFSYPLVGHFNVENVMSACAVGVHLGIDLETIAQALEHSAQTPGRLERVEDKAGAGRFIYVDYAHTPDALEKALSSIKAITQGRTIIVFGCGGDRDKTKRPLMGQAALKADYTIVTSDNPRTEDPQTILNDIISGMGKTEEAYEVIIDRREAIRKALMIAQPSDAVLIAGKGHEDYQLVGTQVLDFDDRVVAAEESALLVKED